MLMSALPLLWVLVLAQHASGTDSLGCQDVQRIELSRPRSIPQQVCVSPGLMTSFVFETPVSVDIQEEIRFEDVIRGRTSMSVLPPRDMAPGERLRFSVRYVDEHPPGEAVTLLLVAVPGQATRQVEIFRDTRTRDSFQAELEQERANLRRLLQEVDRLRLDLERVRQQNGDPHPLRQLIAGGSMTREGVPAREFKKSLIGSQQHTLTLIRGISYRSRRRIAIELWLTNSNPQPWRPSMVDFKSPQYGPLTGGSLWQQERLEPNVPFLLVVEAELSPLGPPAECSVSLEDLVGGVTFALAGIELP